MNSTGIDRVTNRYLNGATAVGDVNPGGASSDPAGSPHQYDGQIGKFMDLTFSQGQKVSDPALTTSSVQAGRFQYVQFAADGTNYAVGQVLYWKDETKYIVTNVAPTATAANVAGFALGPVTQGNYWFAQTKGVAYAQFAASVTSTTAHTAVYLVVNTNTVNALTDATADATSGVAKLLLGSAKDAPSNSGITRVYLKNIVEIN